MHICTHFLCSYFVFEIINNAEGCFFMKKTIGETVGEIRKNKQIPVSVVCSNYIAKSTYTRCIQNKTKISAEMFLEFLDNLNVTFEEFEYIRNNNSKDIYVALMEQIKIAFESQNIMKIKEIKKFCTKQNNKQSLKFKHLEVLCDLLLKKMADPSVVVSKPNALITYLLKIDQWYHYELTLFNNCLFICSPELIDTLMTNIFKNYTQYLNLNNYGNELLRALINLYVFYMNHFQVEKLKKIFKLIQNTHLNEDSLFERNLVLFCEGINGLIFGNVQDSIKKIDKALLVFEILGSFHLKKMFEFLYDQAKKIFPSERLLD